jgi:polar amino acid transport system substrate-binding protein
MKKVLLIAFLSLIAVPAFAADAPKESAFDRVMRTQTLRCGMMLWPPYFEKDPNTGAIHGYAKDLSDGVASLLGVKIEYVEIVPGQQVEELKDGRVDAVCDDGPYVFSEMKFLDYTSPLYYVPVFAYGRADEQRFKSQGDLNHKDVHFIGMDGDLSVALVQRRFPQATLSTLPSTTDSGQLMLNVKDKKADITIIDPPSVATFNASNPPGVKAVAGGEPVAIYPVGFSVKKGDAELALMINSGIAALWNTGEAASILHKYDPRGTMFYGVANGYRPMK